MAGGTGGTTYDELPDGDGIIFGLPATYDELPDGIGLWLDGTGAMVFDELPDGIGLLLDGTGVVNPFFEYSEFPDGNCLLFDGTGNDSQLFNYTELPSGDCLLFDGTGNDSLNVYLADTMNGGFLWDGTGNDSQLFNYNELPDGVGLSFDGTGNDSQIYNYSETMSGGLSLNFAPFSNLYLYRVQIIVPAGTVSQDMDKFYLGVRADLPPAQISGGFTVETLTGTSIPFEVRKVDTVTGTVWIFFTAPLSATTINKFYLYYGK